LIPGSFSRRFLLGAMIVVFCVLMLLGSVQMGPVFWNYVPQTLEGANSGTVTITAPASSVSVTSRTISLTNGGANITDANPQPAVTAAGNEVWWSGVVGDTGGLNDIDGVTIYIYKTGATEATFDQERSYGFRWVRTGYTVVTTGATCPTATATGSPLGCFQELGGSGWVNSFTYFASAGSSRPTWSGAGPASGTWSFAATLSDLALYTDKNAASHWNFEVDVQSKSGSNPLATRTGQFDMNMYMQIATSSLNIANTVTPGAINSSLGSTTWSYISNAPLWAQLQSAADPQNQYGDTITINTIMVGSVSSAATCSVATCVKMVDNPSWAYWSTAYQVQVSPTLTMYWYISPPNPMVPGTYTFVYTLNLQWTGTYAS
jgi:hypothetical protein